MACVAKRAVCESFASRLRAVKHREADPKGPPLFVFVPGPAGTHPDPVVSLQSPSCQAPVLPGSRPARLPSCQAPVLPGSRPARLPFCQALAFVSPCSVGLGEGPWGIWGRSLVNLGKVGKQETDLPHAMCPRRCSGGFSTGKVPPSKSDLPQKQSRPSPKTVPTFPASLSGTRPGAPSQPPVRPPVSPLSGPQSAPCPATCWEPVQEPPVSPLSGP